jgi:sugar phosphate isomerase/epimerase
VQIVSTGVNSITCDETKDRNVFEFLRVAGVKFMSVNFGIGSIPESFRAAEKLADEFDVKLAIHNHGGRHWLGCADALNWVFKQTSPRIGLNLDTAWALHSHENPLAMVDRFADRLYGVHIKDFTFDNAGNHEDVVVGTGNLDLPALMKKLVDIGFDGFVALEYEGDVENPVPAIKKCVQAVAAAC